MPSHFALTIRFLDPAFHGHRDLDLPEWPPSPLRVFQSLVAAAMARHRGQVMASHVRAALMWLEQQAAPDVIAPSAVAASGYSLSVPNNAMDIVARAWCRGNESNSGDANPATHRTMKRVGGSWLLDSDAVHYLWPLIDPITQDTRSHVEVLTEVAQSVVAVGWGIDMAVGSAAIVSQDEAEALPGERWRRNLSGTDGGLRVQKTGTLDELIQRHERFVSRVGSDTLSAAPPLSTYATVDYRRAIDPAVCEIAAFSLLQIDASRFRSFDPARRGLTVAGMMRHAVKLAAQRAGWTELRIDTFILGHGESAPDKHHVAVGSERFAYLPLPSIEGRGADNARVVGSIRRCILTVLAGGCDEDVAWARRALSGQELIDESTREPIALLSLLPMTDSIVRQYTGPATSWATVTPVVLPGYDDPDHFRRRMKRAITADQQSRLLRRLDSRIDSLLRKAITQAGFSKVLATHADIECRTVGFWPGNDLAERYGVPDHLRRFPRFHVRVDWRDAQGRPIQVRGPICLGGGRFQGVGLFAAM